MGLFAKIPLPKGTVWWRADPADVLAVSRRHFELLQSTSLSATSEQLLEAVLHHGYYVRQMDAILYICDIARYTNHSLQPNSAIMPNSGGLGSITIRDIPIGEEITENYASFDRCSWARMYGEFGRAIGCW